MTEATDGTVAQGYDAAIDAYAQLDADGSWPRMRWVGRLERRLAPTSAVLDLGCATGVPVVAALAGRHRPTGVDISPEQIAEARRNVADAEFVCASATDVEFSPGSFDAVVSLYTFDHIPREQYAGLLAKAHDWLRPGGWLLLAIEDADQPGATVDWLGVEMFFSMFDAESMRRLVRESGFAIEETAVETQIEQGHEIDYTWILARKAA